MTDDARAVASDTQSAIWLHQQLSGVGMEYHAAIDLTERVIARLAADARREALLAVCTAYGGDPADPVWATPEGIASIIEDLSGQARANARGRPA